MGQSFFSKETTRWQGLGLEPPSFRSEVQRANYYTTMPPPKYYKRTPKMYQSISLWAWPSTLQGSSLLNRLPHSPVVMFVIM